MLPARRSRHDRVATTLAALRDDEVAALVRDAPTVGGGVGGGCSRADVDGVPVFVKRVPITDRELADPYTTANLFDLPAAIRARFDALVTATASLALFFEHLPNELPRWLSDPIGRAAMVERQLFEVVAFLRHREILHLDGHFGNIGADDDRLYLADFGLATSPRFDLSDAERDFARRNADHDADYASMRLVNWLVASV